MSIYHLFLTVLVMILWGSNFIFLKFSLDEMSPLFLCATRFFLVSFPAILFIKPPAAPLKWIILYGLLMFGLQFGLLFMGMYAGMPPGLTSLLGQIQIFFSMIFAAIFLREFPGVWQVIGGIISFVGIGVVAMHLDQSAPTAGFILIIAGSAAWGLGNLVIKKIGHVNAISLVVWGSFIAFFPLLLLSFLFEGRDQIAYSIQNISWLGASSVLYTVFASTLIGYGLWNWLISRYSVAIVVPFTLLAPVIAMICSILILNEPFQMWKLIAGLLVITGLFINFLAPRFLARKNLKMEEAI